MKDSCWTTFVLIGLGLNLARAQVTSAEMEAADAGVLNIVSPEAIPRFGTFYSWQHWWFPPLPFLRTPEATVYDLGGGRFLYDDRWAAYALSSPTPDGDGDATNSPPAAPPGIANPMSAAAYDCALWLKIDPSTNNQVRLTLNNTRAGKGYQIWSITNLSLTNWVAVTNFTGATGSLT